MKRMLKDIIGKMLSAVALNPVGRASLNQVGYVCIPLHGLEILKNLDKHEDITQYPIFGKSAKSVIDKGLTCLYYDRLYTIYQAITNYKPKDGRMTTAEVGVYKGGTSLFMVDLMIECGVHYEHFCFDTFEGHDKLDICDNDTHKVGQFDDTVFDDVKRLFDIYPTVQIYKGRFEDRCGMIEEKTFDVVHLDMDLYAPTLHGLRFLKDRMAARGIIIVDDYGHKSCPGVRQAVDEFLKDNDSFVVFHLLTGQALMIRVGGLV